MVTDYLKLSWYLCSLYIFMVMDEAKLKLLVPGAQILYCPVTIYNRSKSVPC